MVYFEGVILQSGEHPRLSNAPLVETIFELRYNPILSVEEIREKLLSELPDFKNEEFLHPQQFVFEVKSGEIQKISDSSLPLDLVQSRYKNEQREAFLQLGNGIISFNLLDYQGFDDFKQMLSRLLIAIHEQRILKAYRGISLRYLNHFSLGLNPERVFAWLAPIPNSWNTSRPLQNLQQIVLQTPQNDIQIVTVSYPQTNQKGNEIMVFDIQNQINFPLAVEPNVEELENWLWQAHEQTYKTFREALKPSFFEELK